MARFFEKISFEQFSKDITSNKDVYDLALIPTRSTKKSAGYDFKAIEEFTLKPGEIKKIPTGVKVNMNDDEVLLIVVRSSMGFKYNIRLCNQVGVIDSDYYNNASNEGHIWIALKNEGNDVYTVKKGEAFAQGIFTKFLTVDIEEKIEKERKGGLGSTNKEENDGK